MRHPLALLVLAAGSCGGAASAPDAQPIAAARYEHALTPCASNPPFNCRPSVSIGADGHATIIITDIANSGTIAVDGDRWRWTADGAADVPTTIFFTRSAGDQVITDDFNHWAWMKIAP